MLKTPKWSTERHPVLDIIAGSGDAKILGEGYVHGGLNFEHRVFPRGNAPVDNYPDFAVDSTDDNGGLSCYGVCDSPQQFIDKFGAQLAEDARTFFVNFHHVRKYPDNAGQGGGWRWHKWGPYYGTGTPTQEYLDDEKDFADGVWVFHIFQLAGPRLVWDHKQRELIEAW